MSSDERKNLPQRRGVRRERESKCETGLKDAEGRSGAFPCFQAEAADGRSNESDEYDAKDDGGGIAASLQRNYLL